jgi:hypothetical protein
VDGTVINGAFTCDEEAGSSGPDTWDIPPIAVNRPGGLTTLAGSIFAAEGLLPSGERWRREILGRGIVRLAVRHVGDFGFRLRYGRDDRPAGPRYVVPDDFDVTEAGTAIGKSTISRPPFGDPPVIRLPPGIAMMRRASRRSAVSRGGVASDADRPGDTDAVRPGGAPLFHDARRHWAVAAPRRTAMR